MDNFEWIKEIDYKKYLNGDLKIIVELIGIEAFLKLYSIFAKTTVYFSEKPLMEMKQEYIKKHFGSKPEKELARMLNVSERLVYKIGTQKIVMSNQQSLFE